MFGNNKKIQNSNLKNVYHPSLQTEKREEQFNGRKSLRKKKNWEIIRKVWDHMLNVAVRVILKSVKKWEKVWESVRKYVKCWESKNKCEKVWKVKEIMLNAEKVWKSMRKCEKVWESVGKYAKFW